MLDLPVTGLPDIHVGSFAARAFECLGPLEEEHRSFTFSAGKFVEKGVAVGEIDLYQLLAVLTYTWEESYVWIIFSHTPADPGTFVTARPTLENTVFTHLLPLPYAQPRG